VTALQSRHADRLSIGGCSHKRQNQAGSGVRVSSRRPQTYYSLAPITDDLSSVGCRRDEASVRPGRITTRLPCGSPFDGGTESLAFPRGTRRIVSRLRTWRYQPTRFSRARQEICGWRSDGAAIVETLRPALALSKQGSNPSKVPALVRADDVRSDAMTSEAPLRPPSMCAYGSASLVTVLVLPRLRRGETS
jgi:hypothetical protein